MFGRDNAAHGGDLQHQDQGKAHEELQQETGKWCSVHELHGAAKYLDQMKNRKLQIVQKINSIQKKLVCLEVDLHGRYLKNFIFSHT